MPRQSIDSSGTPRTEIEAITGRIVALGARHGVPTPANELLLALVKTLEANPRASG